MIRAISILIVFTGMLHWSVSNGQGYFNNRYSVGSGDGLLAVTEIDSGYLCAGSASNKIVLLNLDMQGIQSWTKSYGQNGQSYYAGNVGSLIETFDGGFALGGSMSNATSYGVLWRFDENGDSLWSKQYGSNPFWQAFYQCKQTPDSGFVLIGMTTNVDSDGDIWLVKTDKDGTVEWELTYGGPSVEYGYSLNLTNDSGYILGGFTRSYGAGGADMYVVKVDSNGIQQWDTTFGGLNDDGAAKVIQTGDGGYLVIGAITLFTLSTSYDQRQPYIIKLNNQGEAEWENGYGPARFVTTLTAVHEQSDGSFVVAGQRTNRAGTPNGNGFAEGIIIKVNDVGDSLWYRVHEFDSCDKNDDYVRDMKPTSDGGFITAGFFSPRPVAPCNDTGTQDMWVLKLDSCGCAYVGCDSACQELVGIDDLQFTKNDLGFVVYPNPFSGTATVKLNIEQGTPNVDLRIYDITGRRVKTYALSKGQTTLTLQANEIGTGMFLVRLISNDRLSASQRIVILE